MVRKIIHILQMVTVMAGACAAQIGLADAIDMPPQVFLDACPLDSISIVNGKLISDRQMGEWSEKYREVQIYWHGNAYRLTRKDRDASAEWIRKNSVLDRVTVRNGDLYWENRRVNLGAVDVREVFEAIPWGNGILLRGRTVPRKRWFERWPFKGDFYDVREVEPFCAMYFDLDSLKGEDLYLNGKVDRSFLIYPLPR